MKNFVKFSAKEHKEFITGKLNHTVGIKKEKIKKGKENNFT
jgi:hypothetical protein